MKVNITTIFWNVTSTRKENNVKMGKCDADNQQYINEIPRTYGSSQLSTTISLLFIFNRDTDQKNRSFFLV